MPKPKPDPGRCRKQKTKGDDDHGARGDADHRHCQISETQGVRSGGRNAMIKFESVLTAPSGSINIRR